MRLRAALILLLSGLIPLTLSACGGGGGSGGGGSTPAPPPPVTFSHTFPAGDAVGVKGTPWDIIGVTTTLTGQFGSGAGELYDTLRVDTTFTQDVSNALPAPGQSLLLSPAGATQLGIQVAINSDGNTSTGVYVACYDPSLKPYEYLSDGDNRLSDGNYGILGPGGLIYQGGSNPPEEAVTIAAGHVLSQTFFLPAIHVDSGGVAPHIGISVAAFNGEDLNATDCVPLGAQEMYTDTPNLE